MPVFTLRPIHTSARSLHPNQNFKWSLNWMEAHVILSLPSSISPTIAFLTNGWASIPSLSCDNGCSTHGIFKKVSAKSLLTFLVIETASPPALLLWLLIHRSMSSHFLMTTCYGRRVQMKCMKKYQTSIPHHRCLATVQVSARLPKHSVTKAVRQWRIWMIIWVLEVIVIYPVFLSPVFSQRVIKMVVWVEKRWLTVIDCCGRVNVVSSLFCGKPNIFMYLLVLPGLPVSVTTASPAKRGRGRTLPHKLKRVPQNRLTTICCTIRNCFVLLFRTVHFTRCLTKEGSKFLNTTIYFVLCLTDLSASYLCFYHCF